MLFNVSKSVTKSKLLIASTLDISSSFVTSRIIVDNVEEVVPTPTLILFCTEVSAKFFNPADALIYLLD